MKKISLVIIVLLLIGAGSYFLLTAKEEKVIEPLSDALKIETIELKPSANTKTYENPSGFKFDYPDDLQVSENEDLDNQTYADLELTSNTASGSISLKITDTKLKDVNAWIEENEKATASAKTADIKLVEMAGKELKTEESLTLVSIDQKILYEINIAFEAKKDYWQAVYDKIISTFAFYAPQTTTTSQTSESAGSSDILEEIIE